MVADYDDFLPTSRLVDGPNGRVVVREVHIRAADEIAARWHDDAPERGDQLNVGDPDGGSGSEEYIYCRTVNIDQTAARGDADGNFQFKITASYEALSSGERRNPIAGKAAWAVDGQTQKIRVYAVEMEGDQVHYGQEGSGAPAAYDGTGVNVTEDGAQGVDVDDPFEILTIDFWKDPAETEAFLNSVRGIRNRTNAEVFSGPWGDYAAGEARLTRYRVRHVNGETDEVSLSFLIGENRGNGASGDGSGADEIEITLADGTVHWVDKSAHQYFWKRLAKYTDPADDSQNTMRGVDAHVATVYRAGDFAVLGITGDMWA